MINKEKLLRIGGFVQRPREIMADDFPTWTYLSLWGKFLFLDRVLYFWRRHRSSITMTRSQDLAKGSIKFCEMFYHENRGLIAKLGLDCFQIERCLAINAKGELAKMLILQGEYDEAKALIETINPDCYGLGSTPFLYKARYNALKLFTTFRLPPKLLNILICFKRKVYNKSMGKYYPFFFKDMDL